MPAASCRQKPGRAAPALLLLLLRLLLPGRLVEVVICLLLAVVMSDRQVATSSCKQLQQDKQQVRSTSILMQHCVA